MLKKYKLIVIACLILIIAVGGYWYVNKNSDKPDRTVFETGFTMLDDEKNLVWSEAVQVTPEMRARYENEIAKIKADLAAQTNKDDRLADYNNLAVYQRYLGNYRESYNAYLESLKLESQARVAWQNFADVLLKMKAYKSAEMAYKKAVDLNKYIPESYNKLADYYKAIGDDQKVEAAYKLAIETIRQSFESDTLVLNDYANWLEEKKRYGEAIKILQELITKQPENKEAIERRIEGINKNIQ